MLLDLQDGSRPADCCVMEPRIEYNVVETFARRSVCCFKVVLCDCFFARYMHDMIEFDRICLADGAKLAALLVSSSGILTAWAIASGWPSRHRCPKG